LYSGLFDTQDETWDFIRDVTETAIWLAMECKTRSYEDQEGKTRYVTEVLADSIVLLDKKENI
jgi:hypothetical protein